MHKIQEELNKIASDICDNYCKYPTMYTEDEWDEMLDKFDLPCINCPLHDLFVE